MPSPKPRPDLLASPHPEEISPEADHLPVEPDRILQVDLRVAVDFQDGTIAVTTVGHTATCVKDARHSPP